MGERQKHLHFVFLNYDPEYERLQSDRTKRGAREVEMYLNKKHNDLLAKKLEAGTYNKTLSLLIVDAFAVQITDVQANVLRSAKEVRVVEKNQELA
ncbi:subtilisin-like protease SBT2.5 [Tanacetum coccineum]